nr:glycosyl hydrolase [uncultured Pedobacter sp.]
MKKILRLTLLILFAFCGIANAQLKIYENLNFTGKEAELEIKTIYKGNTIPEGLNNNISSFELQKGYMATLAANEDGTGYGFCYVASKSNLILNLPVYLRKQVSFIRVLPVRDIHKKGIGSLRKNGPAKIDSLNVDWYYNWSGVGESNSTRDFIPMTFGKNGTLLQSNIDSFIAMDSINHILTYNEPELNNLPYDVAEQAYRNVLQTGLRVGSPSNSEGQVNVWLRDFMALADADTLRVDFVGIHWYDWGNWRKTGQVDPNVPNLFTRFKNYVTSAYNRYHKPIYITEFNANPNTSTKTHLAFMKLALPWLDAQPSVEGYAWFFPFKDNLSFDDWSKDPVKTDFKALRLPNDDACTNNNGELENLWDDYTTGANHGISTVRDDADPVSFSWDLGKETKIKSITVWNGHNYNPYSYYAGRCAKEYEIWGSNDPNPDGSWESWTKLVHHINERPSGLPYSEDDSPADATAGKAGDIVDFPNDTQAFRYLRFKSIKNWGGTSGVNLMEITVSIPRELSELGKTYQQHVSAPKFASNIVDPDNIDTEAPTLITKNITVYLNKEGIVTINPHDVDSISTDNKGIVEYRLNKDSFSCENLGQNLVNLFVSDGVGNLTRKGAFVTVLDTLAPTVLTKNITVKLVNGSVSINPDQINNGSFDNCSIKSFGVSPQTFACGQYGDQTVKLTVTDSSGNTASKTAIVTIKGNKPEPKIIVSRNDNTYTGGDENTLFLGYGAQELNLLATNPKSQSDSTTYIWSPAIGLSSTNIPNPVFKPNTTGEFTYTVKATNEFGCTDSTSITIKVIDVRCGKFGDKVLLCHKTGSSKNSGTQICIAPEAVATHLFNGDSLGSCQSKSDFASDNDKGLLINSFIASTSLVSFPNPFEEETTVNFTVPANEQKVNLEVYTLQGVKILKLYEGEANVGHLYSFKLTGHALAAGSYLLRLTTSKGVKFCKLIKQ